MGKQQKDTLLFNKIQEKNNENNTINDMRREIKALTTQNQELKALNFKLQKGRLYIHGYIFSLLLSYVLQSLFQHSILFIQNVKIINRFEEVLPKSTVNKHAAPTSNITAACTALQPTNSDLRSSELEHVRMLFLDILFKTLELNFVIM